MNAINGKVLVFTDQHFGIKGNSQLRQKIGINVMKNIIKYVVENNISTTIFMGDYFHSRAMISSDTLNIAFKCMQALASKCRVILILGNHDLFNKNSTDVNSLNIFRDNKNVEIVDKIEELSINSKSALLVPWLGDMSSCKESTYDFMFGHFEVSSKYLIKSYVEEHSTTEVSEKTSNLLDQDEMLKSDSSAAAKLVGDFVKLAKENGTIFAGHIHQHKEFRTKGRNFVFVGSPYQQTLGDIGNACGFYVINESGKYDFIEINNVPHHVQLFTSKIMSNGIDSYDFSEVRNNIVQKVYDIEVKPSDDQKINQKILDFKPYEELLPEYQVQIDYASYAGQNEKFSFESIQKSKLEYIRNYIDSMDKKALDENKIDRDKLYDLMKKYYDAVAE